MYGRVGLYKTRWKGIGNVTGSGGGILQDLKCGQVSKKKNHVHGSFVN